MSRKEEARIVAAEESQLTLTIGQMMGRVLDARSESQQDENRSQHTLDGHHEIAETDIDGRRIQQ
jgi:hypothetical protein